MLTPVTSEPVLVSAPVEAHDVEALLSSMQVGAPYKFEDLYAEYASLVTAEQREPAHSIPLAKALTARDNMRRGRVTAKVGDRRRQVRVYVRTS